MSDHVNGVAESEAGFDDTDALMSRLRVIEDQPLDERASAFAHIHEELRRGLESSDTSA